jgi:hypothetical protein
MSAVLIALGILALLALAVIGLCLLLCEDPEDRARREQARAEADIDADHQAARRAMNDAAGQSWRNLAE